MYRLIVVEAATEIPVRFWGGRVGQRARSQQASPSNTRDMASLMK
jgi:hypothetical protein